MGQGFNWTGLGLGRGYRWGVVMNWWGLVGGGAMIWGGF